LTPLEIELLKKAKKHFAGRFTGAIGVNVRQGCGWQQGEKVGSLFLNKGALLGHRGEGRKTRVGEAIVVWYTVFRNS